MSDSSRYIAVGLITLLCISNINSIFRNLKLEETIHLNSVSISQLSDEVENLTQKTIVEQTENNTEGHVESKVNAPDVNYEDINVDDIFSPNSGQGETTTGELHAELIDQWVKNGLDYQNSHWISDQENRFTKQQAIDAWHDRRDMYIANNDYSMGLENINPLRADLGDDNYAQYLKAKGRATNIAMTEVLAHMPAANAGIKSGDKIVAYDGHRVFHLYELRTLSVQGEYGESVLVDVLRNGELLALSVTRGPLGFAMN